MIHPAYFLFLRETKWTTKITTITIREKRTKQLTDRPVATYRGPVTRPIFSSAVATSAAPILGEHQLHFSSVPNRDRRSLKFFPCSCERYPSETCVDAFLEPPLISHERRGARNEKMPSKGRRLWPLLIPMTRRWKIKEDNGRRQWQNEKGCRRMYQP